MPSKLPNLAFTASVVVKSPVRVITSIYGVSAPFTVTSTLLSIDTIGSSISQVGFVVKSPSTSLVTVICPEEVPVTLTSSVMPGFRSLNLLPIEKTSSSI